VDLTDKFLPSEKLLKKYEDIILDNKGDSILVLTNLRIFLGNKFHLWDVPCKNVDYLKRGFVPRFSRWWLLLFTPLSLIFIGNLIFFLIFVLLSIASQYIKTEALTIGTPTKKWNVRAEPEILDKMAAEIRINALVGDKKDGKIILEAENLDEEVEMLNVELIGQNESRALKAAWMAAIFAFISYYIGSFGPRTGFWTFLFTATAFCFFIIHRDRKKSNEAKGVEAEEGWTKYVCRIILTKIGIEVIESKWSFKLLGRSIKVRNAGYLIFSAILLLGLFVTVASSNMKPLLLSLMIGAPIYFAGRALSGIPRPWKRMTLRSLACSTIAIMIILPCLLLLPLYNSASVELPEAFIQGDSGNGWKKAMSQHEEYGLGFASTSFFLYVDDGEDSEGDSDGYPAMLFVIAIKVPIDLDERDALNELDKQFHDMSLEQEIDLNTHIEDGKRTNKQGYQTQYVIYNGTAKSERLGSDEMGINITKGSETLYIGEVWKAPEYNLLVVSMGIAIVSSQEINDQTGIDPVDSLIDELIPNKPTDTRDTKNWDELYELIPEIVCLSTD
tara:strand:+ start:2844 stop:4517 length:1674 start_codon:yes stop_codon:yes gene_type:complete